MARTQAQTERQTTRRKGTYTRYEYRCEMCDAGINSQADMTPDALYDSVDDLGFVPTVCSKCMRKFDGLTTEQAIALITGQPITTQEENTEMARKNTPATPDTTSPITTQEENTEMPVATTQPTISEVRSAYFAGQDLAYAAPMVTATRTNGAPRIKATNTYEKGWAVCPVCDHTTKDEVGAPCPRCAAQIGGQAPAPAEASKGVTLETLFDTQMDTPTTPEKKAPRILKVPPVVEEPVVSHVCVVCRQPIFTGEATSTFPRNAGRASHADCVTLINRKASKAVVPHIKFDLDTAEALLDENRLYLTKFGRSVLQAAERMASSSTPTPTVKPKAVVREVLEALDEVETSKENENVETTPVKKATPKASKKSAVAAVATPTTPATPTTDTDALACSVCEKEFGPKQPRTSDGKGGMMHIHHRASSSTAPTKAKSNKPCRFCVAEGRKEPSTNTFFTVGTRVDPTGARTQLMVNTYACREHLEGIVWNTAPRFVGPEPVDYTPTMNPAKGGTAAPKAPVAKASKKAPVVEVEAPTTPATPATKPAPKKASKGGAAIAAPNAGPSFAEKMKAAREAAASKRAQEATATATATKKATRAKK